MTKKIAPILILILLSLVATACGNQPNGEVQISIALTQTAAVLPATTTQPTVETQPTSTAAPAATVAVVGEPERISFAAGATSAQIQHDLAAGEIDSFVLTIMKGQELTVKLTPETDVFLGISGADGTIYDSAGNYDVAWTGTVNATQDYTIQVYNNTTGDTSYTMKVIIPAIGAATKTSPLDGKTMEQIALTGVPYMFPSEFPVEAGLPDLAATFITRDADVYEVSMDYGAECGGATACHYGIIGGKLASGDMPTGTTEHPFDAALAKKVILEKGITGYFIEAACGASCGDAVVYWIYDGYEYMVGLKAGSSEDVVALANASIINSIE